ncbi:potassium channel family protein [Streptomyces neyagawaensis]|uniref:potassium channel family protein n=1 Tax=Streptomyces neyagawaensis TaxID=42238 RepID=UPI00099E6F6C|nr:potassium channel protein [Streptomyces neyagawaensis]MCL6738514.1 NAD-binding protein [Streptomyces neyagawaensis]MDE1688659.1 NAD-binding protein [Streptomyces neyagawaensis]
MTVFPQPARRVPRSGHMIVCGDDTLAERLSAELATVYQEQVTLVAPPTPSTGTVPRVRASALFSRMQSVIGRTDTGPDVPRVLRAAELDETVLAEAGAHGAAALALVHEDDETNIRGALAARRLNPRLRLVIRLYNRKLGQHLEELLDQAAALAVPGLDPAALDTSTTVLSDADTAAPALAATAVAGTSKVVQADGLLLRAVERTPPAEGTVADPGLCTLALLSSTTNDPAGSEGSDDSGREGPTLLPDEATVAAATGRGTVVLETIAHTGTAPPPGRLAGRGLPLATLFPARLRWSLAGLVTCVLALAVVTALSTGGHPLHAAYLTLLDLFAINDPALDESTSRQVLQLLAGLAGLLFLPVLLAAALEAFGTFRSASALRRPPRSLSGHVVLLGLGKIGTRVLARLHELGIPVVCVEEDPEARGIAVARRLRVPTVLGDVTQEGVLEAARIDRAHALLALTSNDTTNLEAALYARSVAGRLRVGLRLYDDDFATAVHRTMRAAHPQALTRSRSVSTLAAPAFAGAMMGRQILGAIPVERRVLLFAALNVAGHSQLEGLTVAESFRPGAWRVLALDTAAPDDRIPDLAAAPAHSERPTGLVWAPHPGYVLRPQDRVVLATTRQGLAELLGRQPRPRTRLSSP